MTEDLFLSCSRPDASIHDIFLRATTPLHARLLQVFELNADALKLYCRLGYRDIAQSPVREHPCQPYYTGNVILLEKDLLAA